MAEDFVCPLPMQFFSRPLIGPQIVAGSTRQQPVGRINKVADCGYGDEDKDEDKISSYAVLLTASVERFGVSRMQDFYLWLTNSKTVFVCLQAHNRPMQRKSSEMHNKVGEGRDGVTITIFFQHTRDEHETSYL